ncbi:Inositol phosphorylceramide synthase catalytic subunit aur1 [Exophiala dermatitidis]
MQSSLPSWKDAAITKKHLQLPWRSIQLLVPHRLRRKLRSKLRNRQSPASSISSLQTSFSPADTLHSLQNHKWTVYDAQWLFLAVLGIFSLSIIESPGPLVKTTVATLLLASLIFPITRQFFRPFMPIAAYLIWFYSCRFIPPEWRPPIWVKVLPALENILYGANLSNILSAHKNTALDLLAWFPYGLGHFGAPFVCSAIMFIWGPPTTVTVFGFSFGYMNLIGVITQVLFPCSPPWYENMYGLAPANYSMKGSPAGLARIDALLGFDMYTSGFTASPMVFGAFPSLHAATSTLEALFMSHVFPKLTPLFAIYVVWLWWATMYLSHHYAVDLVAGSMLAGVVFFIAKSKFLPRLQPDKRYRWDYDYIEVGDSYSDYEYNLASLAEPSGDSDEWTIGSSSSISSGSLSPIEESQNIWTGAYSNHER